MAVLPMVGPMGACVIQPTEMVDAGPDAAPIPASCDEFGGECKACQACPEVQAYCSTEITACRKNATCVALGKCNDQCDSETSDAGISKCKTDCCNTAMADPKGVQAYGNVASCLYAGTCPNTCAFQRDRDVCGSL